MRWRFEIARGWPWHRASFLAVRASPNRHVPARPDQFRRQGPEWCRAQRGAGLYMDCAQMAREECHDPLSVVAVAALGSALCSRSSRATFTWPVWDAIMCAVVPLHRLNVVAALGSALCSRTSRATPTWPFWAARVQRSAPLVWPCRAGRQRAPISTVNLTTQCLSVVLEPRTRGLQEMPLLQLPRSWPARGRCLRRRQAAAAPPRVAAPRHTTLTLFSRRLCLQAGGKLPGTRRNRVWYLRAKCSNHVLAGLTTT